MMLPLYKFSSLLLYCKNIHHFIRCKHHELKNLIRTINNCIHLEAYTKTQQKLIFNTPPK